MESKLALANICRAIARIGSILVVLLTVPFLLFVGLQILSGEAANADFFLYLLLIAGLSGGLILAWWMEGLGAAIALVSAAVSFVLSGALLPGAGRGQAFDLLEGPIHLCFALTMPGYHTEMSPAARFVPALSWVIPAFPALLFLISWWLRRSTSTGLLGAEHLPVKQGSED
jgi:hypothetical protein